MAKINEKMIFINSQLKMIEEIINSEKPAKLKTAFKVGVDLGTSDIVVIVIDENDNIAAAFMEWADVVKDGVVVDYWKAVNIVTSLIKKAENRCGIKIKSVNTSYPPGTDPYISINVIKAAGLEVESIIDEPSSFAELLNLDNGAVVDIGGGTTGISVVQNNTVVYTGDEATGGHHLSLTLAGNQKISLEEAELMKRKDVEGELKSILLPVFEKMTEIVKDHITNFNVDKIFLTGGTCCFPGIDDVFKAKFTDKQIILPYNPLYSTPLAITSYFNHNKSEKI